jgi:Tol biopolymer transport system component
MKLKLSLAAVILALATGALLFSGAVGQQTAKELFEKAVYLEETKGDLEKAIETYTRILDEFGENQPLAAKALYRIGFCYERLGNTEAQRAYRRLIEQYPGQKEEVALARARLAVLAAGREGSASKKPVFRKINIPTRLFGYVGLSPDGRKLSLASPPEGTFWILPLTSKLGPDFAGEPVELDTGGVGVEWSAHTWSGDGKWIAFNEDVDIIKRGGEKKEKGNQGIYVVPSEGGKPKKVYENYRDARVINYRISLSADGKILAFSSVNMDRREQHIYSISVDGGTPRQLVDARAREPVFSPDGKMIAYVEDKDMGIGGGGLFVVPAQGGIPKLVANAGNASSPVWSPEGDMIAFVDKEDKVGQIHFIPIEEGGEPAGEKMTIEAPEGIQGVDILAGWTSDNKIGAVFTKPLEFGLYTVPAEGGKATLVSHGGYPVQPRFSPDGKRIFHFNVADEKGGSWSRLAIAVVPVDGGEVTTVPIQLDSKMATPGWGAGSRVSPDGKMIAFSGRTTEGSEFHLHLWTLPVEGGKPKQITSSSEPITDMFPCWSPDGKAIAFVRARVSKNYAEGFGEINIYIINSSGGEPKPLTSESDRVNFGPIAWSPDGRLIAYYSRREEGQREGTLNVIPVEGGEPRVIGKVQGINVNKELAWSPDSQRIAFNGFGSERDKGIGVISLKDGSIVEIKTDLGDTNTYHLDWSRDGKKLVFGGYTGGGREFWLMEDFLPLVKGRRK